MRVADSRTFLATVSTSEIILDMNWVPLIRASPYFYFKIIGFKPFLCIISMAGINFSCSSLQAWPSPIMPNARWESGARSPEAPTVPFSGIIGMKFALNAEMIFSKFSGSMPLLPLLSVFILNIVILLTVFIGKGFPTQTEWDRIRLFWSTALSWKEIILSAKFPNPVLIP